jgi:hypothetical protein
MTTRVLQKRRGRARNEARELLEFFFLSELIHPSKHLWIVSPWLRNFTLFDNRTGAFSSLMPEAPRRELRLLDVLRELLFRGAAITLVTRPPPDDGGVARSLREMGKELEPQGRVTTIEMRELHAKGIVGERAAIIGSMNFTHHGIEVQTEIVQLTTEASLIGTLVTEFVAAYPRGGE